MTEQHEPYFSGEDLVAHRSANSVLDERIEASGAALTALAEGSQVG